MRPTEEERKEQKGIVNVTWFGCNFCCIELLLHLLDRKSLVDDMVVFRMLESIPSLRYLSICNICITSMEYPGHPYL